MLAQRFGHDFVRCPIVACFNEGRDVLFQSAWQDYIHVTTVAGRDKLSNNTLEHHLHLAGRVALDLPQIVAEHPGRPVSIVCATNI